MLIFKRIVTFCFCIPVSLVISFLLICVGGGLIVGFANYGDPEAARQAGDLFASENTNYIIIASCIVALVFSLWITFSGLLPWCSKITKMEPLNSSE
ncbi:MAG: hypothetical protein OCC45_07705 [Desulfotalea sp.]